MNKSRLPSTVAAIFSLTVLLSALPPSVIAKSANKDSNKSSAHTDVNLRNAEAIRVEDELALRTQAKEYALEYGRGNAQALAAQWALEGTFTDATGQQFHGRGEIEKTFAEFFKANGLQPLTIEVESIKFPAANIAIEVGVTHAGKGDSKYTAIHSKETGHWQMVAVFENEYVPESAAISMNDLAWLVGSWQANADTRMQCEWTAAKQFLRLDFYSSKSDSNTPTETEIVGLNPVTRGISSWHFNSDGGVAYGRWAKEADHWLINARGTERNGAAATAQYVMHKVDDNNYSWKSTKRYAAGKALPDTGEILLLRRDSK